MAKPSGAHTHPPQIGGGAAVIVVAAVVIGIAHDHGARHAVHEAGSALTRLAVIALIALAVVLGLAVAGTCAVALARRRREPRRAGRGWTATVEPGRGQVPPSTRLLDPPPASKPPMRSLPPASGRPIDRMPPAAVPREVHYHVHVHGDGEAEAVAQAMRDIAEGR